ncbi:MAG: hypothetical protein L3K19_02490 [Thermoplasmata archaeon]|nr:hypothetical protein [Thermoplasmata archaeon]
MRAFDRPGACLVVILVLAPGFTFGAGAVSALAVSGSMHLPRAAPAPGFNGAGRFAFVSNFENHTLGGWHSAQGNASVVSSPSYSGEPSLSSTAGSHLPQIEFATRSFVAGAASLSMRADLYYAGNGSGYFGLFGPQGAVALVGVSAGSVWAGPNLTHLQKVGGFPAGTAQPAGWVDLMASLRAPSSSNGHWVMDVYVDRTDVVAASKVAVPGAGGYAGAILETTRGTVDFTNMVFTTNEIPITIPKYNNMDGYGQGSGLTVGLLAPFTTLTGTMTLQNWNIPQRGILSFQINAMDYIGTVHSTCRGFYQLGVDLNPGGRIAPWFVPNGNCIAHYFNSNNTARVNPGFHSPPGTRLQLTIQQNPGNHSLRFQIVDLSIGGLNRTVSATIPYNSTLFYGAYSQVEWQPCCSNFPIGSYFLNASLRGLTIGGGSVATPTTLDASYMVPYALDTPPAWSMTYYRSNTAAYDQVA